MNASYFSFLDFGSLLVKYSYDITISSNRKSKGQCFCICISSVISYNFSLLYTKALSFPVISQNKTPQGAQVYDLTLQIICWKYQVATPQPEDQRIRVVDGVDFRAKQEKSHVPAQVVGRKDMD